MFYVNRSLCNVLDEMRKLWETRNFAALAGLIEEAQIMGNKMEASIGTKKDVERGEQRRVQLKAEIKALLAEKEALKPGSTNEY